MRAYVLIKIKGGMDESVLSNRLCNLHGVEEVHLVFGPWDILLETDLPDENSLSDLVSKIRMSDYVIDTSTLIVD